MQTAERHFVAIRPPNLRLDSAAGLQKFRRTVGASRARVVFVDPLAFAHEQNENDNSEMAPLLRRLTDLAHDLGILVILVHHRTKSGSGDDMRSIRGAGAFAGATEANLLLSGKAGSPRRRLVAELRDHEGADLNLLFNPSSVSFRVLGERTAVEQETTALEQRVVAALASKGQPAQRKEIAEAAGVSVTAVAGVLEELQHEGLIELDPRKVGKAFLYRISKAA
jgi:hypothetical protein